MMPISVFGVEGTIDFVLRIHKWFIQKQFIVVDVSILSRIKKQT